MMYKIRVLLGMMIIVFLTSCSLLSPIKTGPDTKYIINRVDHPVSKRPHRKITLLVAPVQSDPIYATKQMAYSLCPYRVAYYVRNHWASTPAQMLQTVLINTLRCTGYYYAVDPGPGTVHYNYILNVRLLELRQIIHCGCGVVKLSLYVQLINTATNRIVAAKQFTVIEPVPEISPCGEAVAANAAAACIAKIISNYTINRTR